MSDDVDKKDLILKGLVWAIPVIFGAGALVQIVSRVSNLIARL